MPKFLLPCLLAVSLATASPAQGQKENCGTWLRYSTRTLLVAMTLIAASAAWYGNDMRSRAAFDKWVEHNMYDTTLSEVNNELKPNVENDPDLRKNAFQQIANRMALYRVHDLDAQKHLREAVASRPHLAKRAQEIGVNWTRFEELQIDLARLRQEPAEGQEWKRLEGRRRTYGDRGEIRKVSALLLLLYEDEYQATRLLPQQVEEEFFRQANIETAERYYAEGKTYSSQSPSHAAHYLGVWMRDKKIDPEVFRRALKARSEELKAGGAVLLRTEVLDDDQEWKDSMRSISSEFLTDPTIDRGPYPAFGSLLVSTYLASQAELGKKQTLIEFFDSLVKP